MSFSISSNKIESSPSSSPFSLSSEFKKLLHTTSSILVLVNNPKKSLDPHNFKVFLIP